MVDLSVVNFGHIAAEEEAKELSRYFVQTSEYSDLIRHQDRMIVIGRKGSGKSAIYVNLRDTYKNGTNSDVIALELDDYPWNVHKRIRDESGTEQRGYVASWNYLILVELTKLMLDYEAPSRYKLWDANYWRKLFNANRRRLSRFMRDTYGTLGPSFGELLRERLRSITKLGIMDVTFESLPDRDYRHLVTDINTKRKFLQDVVLATLSDSKTYYILFDQLDRNWDNTDETKQMLIGLIIAARDLLRDAQEKGKKLRIIIFLRDDIYAQLQFEDKNKLSPGNVRLIWNNETLLELITKRVNSSANASWDEIITGDYIRTKQRPFPFMLNRTLYRPRDIINFCNVSLTNAQRKSHAIIEKEDIVQAEQQHSMFMRDEYLDENRAAHPYFQELLEIIREIGTTTIQIHHLIKKCEERNPNIGLSSQSALELLIELSVLGVRRPQAGGGRPWIYRYQVDPGTRLEAKDVVKVHPCLVKVLSLSEVSSAEDSSIDGDD